ncbi:MAG: hypothetical protein VX798_02280 [Bacteroidota bacterium]|uniref:Uncharacterized protein n=1 Tax=Flagellimonas profundi TaxID=2915620 RepID=A0ABS3FG33_9FLAO|nr:hypothetical protein [Allomuricauda profundi]MBO0342072.1 hypothetical protein [Allomuricauda profundi]MEC7769979.1 hypothetical protein [Bacteroidota bacterium]
MNEQLQNKEGTTVDSISSAQSDLRQGYADGAMGVLASGSVWLAAALVAIFISSQTAIWTLFFGGMLIHPIGLLLAKLIGVPGSHSKQNPLGKLAMEGTIFMLMCIPLALLLSLQNHAWFFQGMLLIIGGRYLTFSTLYGIKTYWVLGGLLGVAAIILFYLKVSSGFSALAGSIIEVGFSIFLFLTYKKRQLK